MDVGIRNEKKKKNITRRVSNKGEIEIINFISQCFHIY